MEINPYALFVGTQNPRQIIAGTAARLDSLTQTLGPAGLERSPAPGKWCTREILCHLADCEVVFAFRLRQALAEPHHVIQPFDQDKWADAYGAFEAPAALNVFRTVRQWNLKLIDSLAPEDFSKPLTHPERGKMTFQVLVETMAGHDLNHVWQIEAIATKKASS
jgi:hypothetical protein